MTKRSITTNGRPGLLEAGPLVLTAAAVLLMSLTLGGCPPVESGEQTLLAGGQTVATGAQGARGAAGAQAAAGQRGSAGALGEDGREGGRGPAGPQGAPGENGSPGRDGDRGERGETGARGEAGAPGEDGQLRIYGDGSAGEKIVASDEFLSDANLQYTDFVVENGVTLTVASGTVIRCTGGFINRGTIRVNAGAPGGFRSIEAPEEVQFDPHPGIASRAATHGELGTNAASQIGGFGGLGMTEFEARQVRFPGTNGGGGGGAAGSDTNRFRRATTNVGSSGGGTLVVLARSEILNDGRISADGQTVGLFIGGGGGGGGGLVILASAMQVSNPGEISAQGGNGQNSDTNEGPSGGGGGGVIHLIAPLIDNGGIMDVSGGSAGIVGAANSVIDPSRSGGGGGGASGGGGGAGGAVILSLFSRLGDPQPAQDGLDGFALETPVDPTALF